MAIERSEPPTPPRSAPFPSAPAPASDPGAAGSVKIDLRSDTAGITGDAAQGTASAAQALAAFGEALQSFGEEEALVDWAAYDPSITLYAVNSGGVTLPEDQREEKLVMLIPLYKLAGAPTSNSIVAEDVAETGTDN